MYRGHQDGDQRPSANYHTEAEGGRSGQIDDDRQWVSSSDPLAEGADKRPLDNIDNLTIARKRHVPEAMELLDPHQYARREAPKPPLPESIDDPRNGDLPLKPVESGDPEIRPR